MTYRRMLKKHLPSIFSISAFLLFLLSLAGCALLNNREQQHSARSGLETIVNSWLPESNALDIVEVVSFDDSRTEHGMTCFYATDYLIMGSSMPGPGALQQYTKELQELGWELEGDQYPTTKVLTTGQNSRIIVRSGEPGAAIEDAVDYSHLQTLYESIIIVRVNFMSPSREGC
jgi:hypothetical protein